MQFGMPTLIENRTIDECAALCRNLQLDFIELSMSLPQYTLDTIDVPHFRDVAAKYGITYTIHLDENVNVCDFNTYIADACCRYVTDTIRLAKTLGVSLINMHLHRGEHFTLPDGKVELFALHSAHYKKHITAFRDLCEETIGDSGILICIENCKGFPAFQQEALQILLESPVFGLTFDIGHDHVCGGVDEPFITANKHRLHHMHMHDALGRKDHLALGTGEIDIQKYLALARAQDCSVVLETKTIEGLTQSVGWMRQNGGMK